MPFKPKLFEKLCRFNTFFVFQTKSQSKGGTKSGKFCFSLVLLFETFDQGFEWTSRKLRVRSSNPGNSVIPD